LASTVITIDPAAPDPATIARAAELLRNGEIVALPTETVYGLGANALDERAVGRIFEAKGRPSFNPLIVHVADEDAARRLVTVWPKAAARLAAACWPGPLTMVLPKQAAIPDIVTAGLPTVGVRVPRHRVMLAVLTKAGIPIAAPSANRSGEVSPTTAQHVIAGLGDAPALILDAGPTELGLESTVIDLSGDSPVLLRPGVIQEAELARLIGPVQRGVQSITGSSARPSPGMLDRHYAPKADLRLVETSELDAAVGSAGGGHWGMIVMSDRSAQGNVIRLPADPIGYGRALYAALHRLDDQGCTIILVERPPETSEWEAVRDRLTRAAKA
jgi:L-threonylcarbamoyladenylate synthase